MADPDAYKADYLGICRDAEARKAKRHQERMVDPVAVADRERRFLHAIDECRDRIIIPRMKRLGEALPGAGPVDVRGGGGLISIPFRAAPGHPTPAVFAVRLVRTLSGDKMRCEVTVANAPILPVCNCRDAVEVVVGPEGCRELTQFLDLWLVRFSDDYFRPFAVPCG
jgi:hypothetical protein